MGKWFGRSKAVVVREHSITCKCSVCIPVAVRQAAHEAQERHIAEVHAGIERYASAVAAIILGQV